MSRAADARRIEKIVRLEPDEETRAYARAWVSRPTRLGPVTQGRVRAVVALTNRRLFVYSVGFWTRRPRRRVLLERVEGLAVEHGSRGRVKVTRPDGKAWILEFGSGSDATDTVRELRDAVAPPA